MKLVAVTMFGIGYVLGTKAGRERYEQIRRLAHNASESFDASGARQRLEALAAQLDGYSSRDTVPADTAERRTSCPDQAASSSSPPGAGPGRSGSGSLLPASETSRASPQQGDMVIRALVRARLLGMQLLTLEARVVVGTDDGLSPVTPPLILSSMARAARAPIIAARPASSGSGRGSCARSSCLRGARKRSNSSRRTDRETTG